MTTASETPDLITKNFGGVISDNKPDISSYATITSGTTDVVQEFYLPSDYKRGDYIPNLTGFDVFIKASTPNSVSATYSFKVSETTTVTSAVGNGTNVVYTTSTSHPFSIGDSVDVSLINNGSTVSGFSGTNFSIIATTLNTFTIVNSTSGTATFTNSSATHWITLVSGTQTKCAADSNGNSWYPIRFKSISIDSAQVSAKFKFTLTFAANSVNRIYYTTAPTGSTLSGSIGATSCVVAHRIFAGIADSGVDFLSNTYRSVVVDSPAAAITTYNPTSQYWMSKPNPSEFGVENLYFELGSQKVIDSIYLDPVTPNIYFNVYYSNDTTGPGYSDDTWDNLLWTHIPTTFKATKKQNYTLPEPIFAKFIKIEFSHLQAQPYAVGTFQKPIFYKKHPKWVLDYFLTSYTAKRNKTYDLNIQGTVDLTYDALDLAYNYYKDDIFTSPNGVKTVGLSNYSNVSEVLLNTEDTSRFDSRTLSKIKLAFRPFADNPAIYGNNDTIIGKIVRRRSASDRNSYTMESTTIDVADTGNVSVLDREPLVLEKNFPVMYFYVPCRHGYRRALASFENDKAYFAGINAIAFQRQRVNAIEDSPLYIENTGDIENVSVNDFHYGTSGWSVQ
jgi:hypothetical protein